MNPVVTLLAKRFLTGKKRNRFLSFISLISLFGVALGVAALIVVMAVMEGFETKLHSLITSTHSHIILYSSKNIIRNSAAMEKKIEQKFSSEIQAISTYIFSEVMLAHQGKVVGSLIEGINRESAERTTKVLQHISQGEFPVEGGGIVLGSVVAEQLGAEIGAEISVISPYFEEGIMQPRSKKFRVTGVLSTGMYEYDSKYSFILDQEAISFFQLPKDAVSAIRIKTKNTRTSSLLAAKLKQSLGYPYIAKDWTELNQNLLYAIRLQKIVIFIVLASIIVVAAFNIMSTLVIMMDEKRKEISILKAIGLQPRDSSRVFMIVGFLIGTAGAIAGVLVGLILCQILATTRFVHLPPDVYFISYLPVDMRFSTIGFIFLSSIGIAVLSTLYPAWKIARESPLEGLRYE